MAKLIPTGLVWVIYPDQPITRRKWRHMAYVPGTDLGDVSAQFGPLIERVLEHEPASIVLKLPNGADCVIQRVPTARKDP